MSNLSFFHSDHLLKYRSILASYFLFNYPALFFSKVKYICSSLNFVCKERPRGRPQPLEGNLSPPDVVTLSNFIISFSYRARFISIVLNEMKTSKSFTFSDYTMNVNATVSCTVPWWFGIPERDDPAAWVNEAFVAAVNIPLCAFAFFSNLVIIVTIIKAPSLQTPFNTLLCSLAATDCLTSITAQPIFVTLRLMMLHQDAVSACFHLENLFTAFYTCTMLTCGWSFVFLIVISFDRHYALSRPFVYRAGATVEGNVYRGIQLHL